MLKYRVKKIEDREPKPEPENIIYKAYFGHEVPDEPEAEFIACWKENGAEMKQYKKDNGDIIERKIYKTKWPAGKKAHLFDNKNESDNGAR